MESSKSLQTLARQGVSTEALTKIPKRFTTKGPPSQREPSQRHMLATSRTVWESRFLFHARDTALFYKNWSFFGSELKPSKDWTNTTDAQALHEGNEDSNWRNSLRHGLALMMASQNLKINTKDAGEIFRNSKSALLSSCSPNGRFPGYLIRDKQPDVFPITGWQDKAFASRDNYWHISFELPYLMWTFVEKNQISRSFSQARKMTLHP